MKLKKFLSTSSFLLIATPSLAGVGDPYDTIRMCRPCPIGYVGNGKSKSCSGCAAGTFQDEVGQGQCKDVPAGNCATGTANTSYETCLNKAGRSKCSASDCSATGCKSGYYLSGGECHLCPVGHRCPGDSKAYECSPGTYQASEGKSSCDACPVGTYSSSSGATSCNGCAATSYGKWSGECGSVSRSYTVYCSSTGSTSSTDKLSKGTDYGTQSCSGDLVCSSSSNGTCQCPSRMNQVASRNGNSCSYRCADGYESCPYSSGTCIASCTTSMIDTSCKPWKSKTRSCHYESNGSALCSLKCVCDPWPEGC